MRHVYSKETERVLEAPQSNLEDTMGGFDDEIVMRQCGRFNPFLNDPDLTICQMELCPFGRLVPFCAFELLSLTVSSIQPTYARTILYYVGHGMKVSYR